MKLDANIWGPHYWFFLHTIALSYPKHPNAVTKKKYYDFIQNLPLFIPVEEMSKNFEKLLNLYPVAPYLDTNKALVKWMHFIHNKINERLEKNTITLTQFYDLYHQAYKPQDLKAKEYKKTCSYILYFMVLIMLIAIIVFLYRR